ncbi:MAG: response regulator [Limisphaerales bacterium]
MRKDDKRPTVEAQQGQRPPCRRILVADDESAIRSLMSAVLVHAGYHVDAAQDGAVAWAALQAEPYDLLITDCDMPKVTGIELVKNLRSARMDLPVILVTGALPWHEMTDSSLQIAATLEKPFTVPNLLGVVGNVLRAAANPHEAIPVDG